MPSVLITGANRGIGLALAKRYSTAGWRVLATARDPAKANDLRAVPNADVYELEAKDQQSIETLTAMLEGRPIDVLINNAGYLGPRETPFGETPMTLWHEVLLTNIAAPFMLTERLVDNLAAGKEKKAIVISSSLASLTLAEPSWSAIYGASKAGVNMAWRHLSYPLGARGIVAAAVSPGWVRTNMGGDDASTSVEESAEALFNTIGGLTMEHNGGFFSHEGAPIPW